MAELIDLITTNFDYDNFFSAKLTAPLTATDTDIFMDNIPTPSEGVLVIDWDVADSREVIFYNSKTASKVVVPSTAERGFDDSTATTHLSGANVIYAPVRALFRLSQQLATTSEQGWKPLGYTPNTIVDNGNRSYTMVFNSVDLTSFLSPGMRLKGDPVTAKPTQCATFDGVNDYFSNASPAGMTFTDDFVCGAWVKPSSYGSGAGIIARTNGTNGWQFFLQGTGTIAITGFNGGAGNYMTLVSSQIVTLNRWSHVAAQLDMTVTTNTSTTNYIMIDGQDVPATATRAGTNPTALVQAGSLNVGALNGAVFFTGKIAQAFVSSAKITQANIRLLKNQGITASDCGTYSIASAFSLSGASGATDINTTNANNLTANGGVLTTTADAPWGLNGFNRVGTSEYGLVMSCTFSTNTTLVIQAPEGCTWPTLPTSSAVTSMEYAAPGVPYGWVADDGRWMVCSNYYNSPNQTPVSGTYYNVNSSQLSVPIGSWTLGYQLETMRAYALFAGASFITVGALLSTTAANAGTTDEQNKWKSSAAWDGYGTGSTATTVNSPASRYAPVALDTATPYYLNVVNTSGYTLQSTSMLNGRYIISAMPTGL